MSGFQLQSAVEQGRTREVPERVNGFETDVIEAIYEPEPHWWNGYARNERAGRRDPLVGGISISNSNRNTYATLGGLVLDNTTGSPMLLSNWHVLVGDWRYRRGQPIYQPGRGDGGTYRDTVATLARDAMHANLDAAVARLNGTRHLVNEQLGIGPVKGVLNIRMGLNVYKSGRASNVTYGMVSGVEGIQPIQLAGLTRIIRHVASIEPLPGFRTVSLPGDSGAWWLDRSGMRAAGLHFAGSRDGTRALAMNMPDVLEALEVAIPVHAPVRMQTPTLWAIRQPQFA